MFIDDKSDNITDKESLFNESVNKSDIMINNNTNSLFKDIDNNINDKESLFNNEE